MAFHFPSKFAISAGDFSHHPGVEPFDKVVR